MILKRTLWLLLLSLVLGTTAVPPSAVSAYPPNTDCSNGTDHPLGSLTRLAGTDAPFGGSSIKTYSIEVENGLGLDSSCLAEQVERTLSDPRSWIHQNNLGWQRTDTDPDLRIIFSSPSLTDQICLPLKTGGIYSCRNGNRVALNVSRWRSATMEYQHDLNEYRAYQINHEVGHFLGNGHTSCPSAGSLAPVMMQQTKSLGGCVVNGWPFPEVEVAPEFWNGTFYDDDNSVFEEDIEWIAEQGITLGCNPPENHRFCPEEPVTRGQMAAFLDRALELPPTEQDYFPNDPSSPFDDAINRLAEAGITVGCHGGTSFCAGGRVTREQMAAFLHRSPLTLEIGTPLLFTDLADSVFVADIEWLSATGVTLGCNPPTNTSFCPTLAVTRGQMAAFLRRALRP